MPLGADDQAAVALGILGLEAQGRDLRAAIERLDQPPQRRRLDQRGIRKQHDHIALVPFQRGPRCQHGMAGAGLRRLLEDVDARSYLGRLGAYRLHARRHDQREPGCSGRTRAGEHVRQHRPAGYGMQNLRDFRAHAHALAGGQNDDQKRVLGHIGTDRVDSLLLCAMARRHATCVPGARL